MEPRNRSVWISPEQREARRVGVVTAKRGQPVTAAVRAYRRAANLRQNYGITLEGFESMLSGQGFSCAICGRPFAPDCGMDPQRHSVVVDHNHATGKVRSILCSPCNLGLGAFRDNAERLRSAAEYLEHHARAS